MTFGLRGMTIILAGLLQACFGSTGSANPAVPAAGKLIIVGGALSPDNKAIFGALGSARQAGFPKIAIIPAASGEPAQSAERFANDLVRNGIDLSDILIVRLALVDDSATRGIDESKWAGNAGDKGEIDKINQVGAIWFTGGDQARIVKALKNSDGSDTAMLAAIRQKHSHGAAIGGSSAGAAMMSGMMILQGDAPGALLPDGSGEKLALGRGLSFVERGLVDQHFGQRARLGRLALALGMLDIPDRIGFGIDENTAMIVDQAAKTATVAGVGYVTILDARQARFSVKDRIAITAMKVGLGSDGDVFALGDGSIDAAAYKQKTVGNEYFDAPSKTGGGMAISGQTLADVLGEKLLDNSGATIAERVSFVASSGVIYRFVQPEGAKAWWGRGEDGGGRYAVEGVVFDIIPVELSIKRSITK